MLPLKEFVPLMWLAWGGGGEKCESWEAAGFETLISRRNPLAKLQSEAFVSHHKWFGPISVLRGAQDLREDRDGQMVRPFLEVPALIQTVSKDNFPDGSVNRTIWCVRLV